MDWDLLYNLDNVMMQRMKDKTYLYKNNFSKIHQMVYLVVVVARLAPSS